MPPIPEIDEAADLFDKAATEYLEGHLQSAESLIGRVDMTALSDYYKLIVDKTSAIIHRPRKVPGAPAVAPNIVEQRMPGMRTQRQIFRRDGWRCRFCDSRVIVKKAVDVLKDHFPNAMRNETGVSTLRSSLDHVLPHSKGGTNELDNLVTACRPCQFGRAHWTLEEVGFTDPRDRNPILDSWDGLTRLC